MTQIIAAVSRHYTFHVSDRLVTQPFLNGVRAFDPAWNKAIIFRATDAHVVVGYTGRAYLDHIPTDTFIAQSLLGAPLPQSGMFCPIGTPAGWTDIGRSTERLKEDIDAAFGRLSDFDQRSTALTVSITGWRQSKSRNRRITPLLWRVQSPSQSNAKTSVTRFHRSWNWMSDYGIDGIPDIEAEIEGQMRAALRERGHKSPDEFEAILINGLLECAGARPDTVGRDLMSVVLPPTQPLSAQITYSPASGIYSTPDQRVEAFSPWIVAPPIAWPPGKLTDGGGWTCQTTGYKWKMKAIKPTSPSLHAKHSAVPRPRDPQSRR